MHVDFLTLACLRDDLDGLLGARVQQVVLADEHSVGLELYAGRRFHLLISAHPQHARLLLVPEKVRRGVEGETPLLLLLRKWVRGARLADVTQPPWERVLVFHFEGREGACQLVAEIMGRYSNIVLVGPDGLVLDALKRIGPDLNRYRVTLPRHPYQLPPPPPGRLPPTECTEADVIGFLANAKPDEPAHRVLVRHLLGISPTAAREVVARATGNPETPAQAAPPAALRSALVELVAPLEDGSWHPHVALDERDQVIAFAPYELRQFERREAVPDISTAMWRYFRARLHADPYAAARQQVRALIGEARARLERTLDQLRAQAISEEEVQALREAGELLLAYQHQVPPGANQVTVPDYTGAPRTIPLDPALTPVENAQAYFKRYEKARRAAQEVPARIAALEADRAFLDQLAADLELAEDRADIDAVREALADAGWVPRSRRKGAVPGRPLRLDVEGFPVYVGRNARQNEEVTFRRAAPDDIWLHVRGLPGGHVVIKTGGRPVPESVLQRAAELAAWYSLARKEGGLVPVDYTERRHVRRIPGGRPGLVTYRHERTRRVRPVPPAEAAERHAEPRTNT